MAQKKTGSVRGAAALLLAAAAALASAPLARSQEDVNTTALERQMLNYHSGCAEGGDVTFNYMNTKSVPSLSGVSVRFQLLDPCGRPLPFLSPSMFSAQAGPNGRHIGNGPRDEGALALSVGQVQVKEVDSSAIYVTLLVDVSMSIDEGQRARVLNSFVDSYAAGSGNTYMRILAFSGHTERLTLTAGCSEGFCDDVPTMRTIINSMQTTLDAWPNYDPEASAIYNAIRDTVDDLGVISQAHADAQHRRAVRTGDSLVVFTDLDESARRISLQDTLDTVAAVHPTMGQVSMVIFDHALDAQLDAPVVAAISAAKQSFAAAIGDEFVVSASDLPRLEEAFRAVAEKVNWEANSWYEVFICPPQRAGEANDLIVSVDGWGGSTTTTFNATGFSNTCPFHPVEGVLALSQSTETTFCDGRGCGFYDGVFCGICDAPDVHDSSTLASHFGSNTYTVHEEHEAPLFRFPAGGFRPTLAEFSVTGAGGTASLVTAHVGATRQLCKAGQSRSGVSISTDGKVTFTQAASQHEVLLHVTPPVWPAGAIGSASTDGVRQTLTFVTHGRVGPPPAPTASASAARAVLPLLSCTAAVLVSLVS